MGAGRGGVEISFFFFQYVFKTNGRKLQYMIKAVKIFSHDHILHPLATPRISALAPGLYTGIKS